jgi:hypothetical protein
MISKEDFYIATKANWRKMAELESREQIEAFFDASDFRSAESAYKYTEDGVYRCSNHWLEEVASCNWLLDGQEFYSYRFAIGFCRWEDFDRILREWHGKTGYVFHGKFVEIA